MHAHLLQGSKLGRSDHVTVHCLPNRINAVHKQIQARRYRANHLPGGKKLKHPARLGSGMSPT